MIFIVVGGMESTLAINSKILNEKEDRRCEGTRNEKSAGSTSDRSIMMYRMSACFFVDSDLCCRSLPVCE